MFVFVWMADLDIVRPTRPAGVPVAFSMCEDTCMPNLAMNESFVSSSVCLRFESLFSLLRRPGMVFAKRDRRASTTRLPHLNSACEDFSIVAELDSGLHGSLLAGGFVACDIHNLHQAYFELTDWVWRPNKAVEADLSP